MRTLALDERDLTTVARAVADLQKGGSLSLTAVLTLTPGATSTTFIIPDVGSRSVVMLSALSASFAAAQPYVMAVGQNSFTVGHLASAATDMSFRAEIRRP